MDDSVVHTRKKVVLETLDSIAMEDEEEDLPDLPEKCPICNKASKNLLLHIRKKSSCNTKIDPALYDHWKREQNKFSKRKFQSAYVKTGKHKNAQEKYVKSGKHSEAQAKYVKSGKHSEAQAKYVKSGKHSEAQDKYVDSGKHKEAQRKYEDKFRRLCKVCTYVYTSHFPTETSIMPKRRQECNCPPADRISYMQTKRQNQQIRRNRKRIQLGIDDGKTRLEKFKKMCRWCLYGLKNGKFHVDEAFNRFHLVEAEVKFSYYDDDGEWQESSDDDETHSWLSDVDGSLLCLVIIFQKVVLLPKSKWIRAIEEINTKEDKKHLKEKLFLLIGKLQSYDITNITEISIPEEYKVPKVLTSPWCHWPLPDTLTKEDEELLVNLLTDIVDSEDVGEELLELLGIDKDRRKDPLETALFYANSKAKPN